MSQAVVAQAWSLLDQGRAADAATLTGDHARAPTASAAVLIVHAAALKGIDRHDEALAFNRRAVVASPGDRIAWYNLAATLGDLALADEGEAAIRKAIALGLDAPEAWLVLGRSGANGGAEAAVLQQAAMALLGGQNSSGGFAGRLGLDEISLGGATEGGATSATVTLGKRVSQDFYVTYARSLAGTLGTLSIFYDLSRRFTLRAQTGEQSAIDLIFTLRYD